MRRKNTFAGRIGAISAAILLGVSSLAPAVYADEFQPEGAPAGEYQPEGAEQMPEGEALNEANQDGVIPAEESITFDENGLGYRADGSLAFAEPELAEDEELAEFGYTVFDSYKIKNAGELAWFAQAFYTGQAKTQNVYLDAHIDMSCLLEDMGFSWSPLGYALADGTVAAYDGVFNGNGYTIENIMLDAESGKSRDLLGTMIGFEAPSQGTMAFFGALGANAKVIDLCLAVGGTCYISGNGARVYQEESHFEERGLKLTYLPYEAIQYPQLWKDFLPCMSVLDYVFNCGYDWEYVLNEINKQQEHV